jgi:hypothetical protein
LQRELGQAPEAAATALEQQKLWPDNTGELCNVARELALAAAVVGMGKRDLSAQEQAERRRIAGQAVAALQRAVSLGYKDGDRLRKDPELELLRPRDDFRKLLEQLEGKAAPAGK